MDATVQQGRSGWSERKLKRDHRKGNVRNICILYDLPGYGSGEKVQGTPASTTDMIKSKSTSKNLPAWARPGVAERLGHHEGQGSVKRRPGEF